MSDNFIASYIVHGPEGCGKTKNSKMIAESLQLKKIVDGWDGDRRTFNPFDTLFITSEPPKWAEGHGRLISYQEALAKEVVFKEGTSMGKTMFKIIGIIEETHKLLTATVELNKKFRAATIGVKKGMSPEAYAKGFCSVYFDIGSQTGKSEWIRNNQTDIDLIVVNTVAFGVATYRNVKADVLSLRQAVNNDEPKSYRHIYFDNSRAFDKKDIAKIYKRLAKENLEQTFIHLG